MKHNLSRTFRSVTSLILVLSMIFGLCGTAIAATVHEDDDVINYVSLGDSMTNGYGLDGYEYEYHVGGSYADECTDVDCTEKEKHVVFHWSNGYLQVAPESYPALVADHFGWSLTQMGMSAMRAEDLHWVLELDYEDADVIKTAQMSDWNEEDWNATFTAGDRYTWDEFATGRMKNQLYPGVKLEDVAKTYQDSVADADVISLGIGNGNFGVFMLGRIMESIGFDPDGPSAAMRYNVENAIRECDPEIQEAVKGLLATVTEELDKVLADYGMDANSDMFKALKNTFTYATISFVLNYAGTVEAILQLNDDVELILVGLMNTMAGMTATMTDPTTGKTVEIDMADVLGVLIVPMNAFIAALPTLMQAADNSVYRNATFYYAEAPEVECMVDTYEDTYKTVTVRDRFITEIVGECDCGAGHVFVEQCSDWDGMVWGLAAPMLGEFEISEGVTPKLMQITRADVEAYEIAAQTEETLAEYIEAAIAEPADMNKLVNVAIYLGFEKAVVAGSKDSVVALESFVALADSANLSNVFGPLVEALNSPAITEEHMATVYGVAAELSNGNFTADQIKTAYEGNNKEQLGNLEGQIDMLAMLIALPDLLGDAAQTDDTLMGLFHLFARCLIGDGLGAHPSVAGHKELADAIISAYENKNTAKDQTIANAKAALEAVAALVAEYYDEAYAYAYDYAEENGYIKIATDAIDSVIADLASIDLSETQMTDAFKAEVAGEIEEIIETLEAAKALILEADELDQATLDALMAMLNEGGEAIENLLNVLAQAGEDVTNLVVIPALEAAKEKLENEIIPELKTKLEAAIKAGTEWLREKLVEIYGELGAKIAEILENAALTLEEKLILIGEELIAIVKEALGLLAEEATEIWNELYYDATHGELTVDNDSYYVSIGDASPNGLGLDDPTNSFAMKLVDELGLDLGTQFKQLGQNGLRVEDIRYILDETYVPDEYTLSIGDVSEHRAYYKSEIAKADFITVSMGSSNFTSFASMQIYRMMQGMKPFEMDWSRFVGEEGVEYVDAALADINAEISAMGLDVSLAGSLPAGIIPSNMTAADFLTFVVECVAYGYAGFALNYTEVLNDIREINPDAQIVVVGMYNPFDAMAIELNGETVAFGEYVDYLVELTDLHYAVYSMLSTGVTFVEVPATETILEADIAAGEYVEVTLMTYVGALINGGEKFLASENGHEYIKDQILNALEITNNVCKHEGGEATCIEKAVCDICGKEYGDVDAENHVNTEIRDAVEATCDKEGYSGDIYCLDCETTVEDGEVIPATEIHINTEIRDAIAATCVKTGYSGDVYCTDCGVLVEKGTETPTDASNHKGETEIRDTVAATCIHTGYSGDTYCLDCGEMSKIGSVTPATGMHIVSGANCHYRGSCEICGIILGTLDESVHCGETEIRGAYEPTAVKDGYTGDTHCEGCGVLLAKGEVIPALGVKIDLDALAGTGEGDDSSIVLYLDKALTKKVTDPSQLADGMKVYYTVEAVNGKVVTEVGASGVSEITNEYFIISDLSELNLVPAYALAGDFDMSGAVNILDAIWMVRYVAGWKDDADMWTITECVPAGDTDANSTVNVLDAINLAKSIAGHDVEMFPAEQSNFAAYIIEG